MPKQGMRDALLTVSKDLSSMPTSGLIYTDAIDLGSLTERGLRLEDVILNFEIAGQSATGMPAAASMELSIVFCNKDVFNISDMSDCSVYSNIVEWTIKGSSSGSGKFTGQFKVPIQSKRYVRLIIQGNSIGTLAGKAKLEVIG